MVVVAIVDVAVRFERLGVFVVLRVVGLESGVEELDHDVSVQMVNAALRVLGIGSNVILAALRRIDARNLDVEVGALDCGSVLRGRRRRRRRGVLLN